LAILTFKGSFEGFLRIYKPRSKRGFLANDMIIEKNLGIPILQVETGRFSARNPQEIALAILHSRKLTVATVA
jgi:hypothetical protein